MNAAAFLQRHRRTGLAIVCAVAVFFFVALLILTYGWAHLRGPLERHFSKELGRSVSIGAVRRIDHSFFSPEIQLGNVHVAQPDWVGGGDMIIVRRANVQLPLLPLLFGQAHPHSIAIDGLTVALVRRDASHANWKGIPQTGYAGVWLQHVIVRNGVLTFDDRKRNHQFTATIAADDKGLTIAGKGELQGHPSTISLTGPALVGQKWPFRFDYRSAIANATLIGTADRPLDIGHFDARAEGWGDDLRHLDQLIEAGLPATQPVRVTARLRHDWSVKDMRLGIGRSNFEGDLTVHKQDGRTKLNGALTSTALDFDDLASNAGLARAAARRAALGPRMIPDTAIHLEHMQKTDGSIRFDIQRLLFKRPSVFQGIMTTLSLDHGILTADPFFARLAVGHVSGFARVKHRSGTPLLTLDLKLTDARIEEPMGDAATGPLAARFKLEGSGRAIREALAHSSGTIGVVGGTGTINRRAALFLGADAGRALFEGDAQTTALRCAIGHFDVKNGLATADTLILDTAVSRSDGSGTIDLGAERLALNLPGRPKLEHAVKLDMPVRLVGTLSDPDIEPKSVPHTIGTFFKLIGNAIGGQHRDPAPDADCTGLAAQALM
jgi:AsmA family protein